MIPAILAHGGVGSKNEHSDGPQSACEAASKTLVASGHDCALQAAIEASAILEDDPRFNAGTGSNRRIDGSIQMDAIVAVSDGRMGSVACIEGVQHPIHVARMVMDSPHVMLAGDGATAFARQRGVPEYNPDTERAQRRHAKALERIKSGELRPTEEKWRATGMHGTIGSVTRASDGTFAVACSTGGTSMMLRGRVGDSPIFGSGVMVGPAGAVCATGDGEEVIRRVLAMRVYQAIESGVHPQQAVDAAVAEFPRPYVVGFIALSADAHGMAATDDKMARGSWFGD